MGQIKGDKARYNRERRKKLKRRVEMRALRATLTGAVASGDSKAAATQGARPAPAKTSHS
ncbi:MAG: hypothetical protein HY270_02000 [Deltaproteobacteria bacterium]|nr:hypothetical protein [Deltaproteobacteria bacterium]